MSLCVRNIRLYKGAPKMDAFQPNPSLLEELLTCLKGATHSQTSTQTPSTFNTQTIQDDHLVEIQTRTLLVLSMLKTAGETIAQYRNTPLEALARILPSKSSLCANESHECSNANIKKIALFAEFLLNQGENMRGMPRTEWLDFVERGFWNPPNDPDARTM